MAKELYNGVVRDMSAEDEAAVSIGNQDYPVSKMVQKIEKKEADKASAKAKLIAGEALTEDEADAIAL